MNRQRAWLLLAVLVLTRGVLAAADKCAVCGAVIENTVYFWNDKVAGCRWNGWIFSGWIDVDIGKHERFRVSLLLR